MAGLVRARLALSTLGRPAANVVVVEAEHDGLDTEPAEALKEVCGLLDVLPRAATLSIPRAASW
jgi:hypothetical protein